MYEINHIYIYIYYLLLHSLTLSNSEYLAHSEPLFKTLKLLKIYDLYKLKLMKFYYNLSYNVLPSYFNCYLEVIDDDFPCQYALRQTSRPLIRSQMTRLVSTESSVLHQLIQLLNCTHTQFPEIIEKLNIKLTYFGFSYNVKEKYLGTYIYECTNLTKQNKQYYICTNVVCFTYMYVGVYVYVCICACIYIYIYICMYICFHCCCCCRPLLRVAVEGSDNPITLEQP